MQRRQPPQADSMLARAMRRPQIVLPVGAVVLMLALAFGIQPGAKRGDAAKAAADRTAAVAPVTTPSAVASPSPSADATQPSAPGANASASPRTGAELASQPAATRAADQPSSDVAGVRASATPAAEPDFSRESTQCGVMQETAVPLSVEQSLSGASVRATRAAIYPIEYFRCMLMATGGRESVALAGSLSKAQNGGATHAVLLDLWIANGSREFAQVNLKTSSIAAAGQAFAPLATLGGRSEVVVSTGQGRAVTLVVAIKNTVGAHTGPMTLTIEAPLAGGKQTPGKYQLFLPTP